MLLDLQMLDLNFEFYFAQVWIITRFPFLSFSLVYQSQFKPSPSTFVSFFLLLKNSCLRFPFSISPYMFILTVGDFYS